MTNAKELMSAATTAEDSHLESMVRTSMLQQPVGTRQLWLRETELALDGYGGERNRALGDRVRDAIQRVSAGLGAG
ncbi:MAG: hypothetical protein KDD77_04740 [Caldilineaceae bacterium]|nr:hypothetical protein [Caldilineaceae bacterium]